MDTATMPLSDMVRELREAKGWSQEDLSQNAGVSISSVRKVEQGDTPNPTSLTLIRMVRALGGSLDAIGEKLEAEGYPEKRPKPKPKPKGKGKK